MGIDNEPLSHMDIQEKIDQLTNQVQELARQQTSVSQKLIQLMNELEQLKNQAGKISSTPTPAPERRAPQVEMKEVIAAPKQPVETVVSNTQTKPSPAPAPGPQHDKKKTTLEEFIGGNLTSKVGILITIIGIFIGAKYAIENNLVNPRVRVIMGYVNGLILVGIAIRLRKKYEQYSAVLMGGGLAVLYFITYIAYSFYSMLPQMTAFGLMLLFTAGTVYAALLYNRIIIAHLGLIGAYAIPILLSDQSGRYAVMFAYIAIINAGILVLSLKKNWKSLFYAAFVFTWLIYLSWYLFEYEPRHFSIAYSFLGFYFVIFYATFLAYKLIKKEQYNISDVAILLSNAFIFYGVGYSILDSSAEMSWMVGLFTVINAFIHLIVSVVIKKLQLADKALFYLLVGLVITFITIAIPVQLDGNWVTLLWTMEAMLVFIIGRTQSRPGYESLGVALIILAMISLSEDWSQFHPGMASGYFGKEVPLNSFTPFFNIIFFTGLFVCAAYGAIIYLHHWKKLDTPAAEMTAVPAFYEYILPGLMLLLTYLVFLLEIQSYFVLAYRNVDDRSLEMELFNFNTGLLYTMVFTAILTFINMRWIKKAILGTVAIPLSFVAIVLFLTRGLNALNDLADTYLAGGQLYFGVWVIVLRYALIAATVLLLLLGQRAFSIVSKEVLLRRYYGAAIHLAILALISYEYLLWMDTGGSGNEYKLGLSIVWSVYALFLVVAGIIKKKKHWRLTGIAFFVVTLVKLFTYDLSQTTTISKTISFISLGAILLLVSYLYNRYKHVILADDEEI